MTQRGRSDVDWRIAPGATEEAAPLELWEVDELAVLYRDIEAEVRDRLTAAGWKENAIVSLLSGAVRLG